MSIDDIEEMSFDENRAVAWCWECNTPLYYGDRAYKVEGEYYCPECIDKAEVKMTYTE